MNSTKLDQYRDKFWLLNRGEQCLYKMLCEAAPNYIVFSQVSMSQIFYQLDDEKRKEIGNKSIDFLLCRKDDTSMVLAIELNGPDHEKEIQKLGDERKRAALKKAGIPLLPLYADSIPDIKQLGRLLAENVVDRVKNEQEKKLKIQNAKKSKSFCASCKSHVTDAVIDYCVNQKNRFNGKIYCIKCQMSI